MKMTKVEQDAIAKFKKRKKELEDQIQLLRVQMFDLEVEARERNAKFKLGDVIEYQKEVGYRHPRKTQVRKALLQRYRHDWEGVVPFWRVVKKDLTLSIRSYYSGEYIRDLDMVTARKIGIWDFEKNKFVSLEE